jgi:hypothetical protein
VEGKAIVAKRDKVSREIQKKKNLETSCSQRSKRKGVRQLRFGLTLLSQGKLH